MIEDGGGARWQCARCGQRLGTAAEDYRRGALRRVEALADVTQFPLPSGGFVGELHEYLCPGCATLLQVQVFCPALA